MSREKRYVFKMMLTPEQNKLIEDTVDECLGIAMGEKLFAEIHPENHDGSMIVVIVPPEASKTLDAQLREMRLRTEVDTLGLIG